MREALDGPSMTAGHRKRDLWLAAAACALAVRALLGIVEILLMFAWYGFPDSSLAGASFVLGTIGGLVALAAFAIIGIALAGSAVSRQSRWRMGWLLLAAAFVLSVAGLSISIYSAYTPPIDTGYPYRSISFLTSNVIQTITRLWRAAAAVLMALLFVASPGRSRNRRLGWAATGFAVVWGMSMLYMLIADLGPWAILLISWDGIGWPDTVFLFAAAVIAAVAFFGAARSPRFDWAPPRARRERLLTIAALSLLVAYTWAAIEPAGYSRAGLAWREQVLDLLRILPGVAIAVAALLAVVGFWVSARSLRPPASSPHRYQAVVL